MKNLAIASVNPTTFELYSKQLDSYRAFAREHRLDVSLPISTENLGLFLSSLYEKDKSYSTIVGYVNAISFFHKLYCLPDPYDSNFIEKLLNGIKKLIPPSDKRKAINLNKLELMLDYLPSLDLSCYDVILYRAMFLFIYYGCLRVGEVAKASNKDNVVSFEQLECKFVNGKIDSLNLKFFKFKHSDTVRNPRKQKSALPIMTFTKKQVKRFCPVRIMFRYLKVRGPKKGQLFLKENGDGVSYYSFNSVMKKCISGVGLPEGSYGTHSFRIGRSTDLHSLGYTESQIKVFGRWKSGAFLNYIRPDVIHI